jgi:pyridoxal 5'-phosphate synthase pdxT subunit
MTTIGVLALQGDFAEHAKHLAEIGAEARQVRLPAHLERLDGLILPGGESTTIARLLEAYGLIDPLRELATDGFPLWGTCAGAILLARRVPGLDRPTIGALDIGIQRNAFGRQIDSFEVDLPIPVLGETPFHAVFIRAPVITDVGPSVKVVAHLEDGRIVAVQSGNVLATAFHPELTADHRLHSFFLQLTKRAKARHGSCNADSS